MKGSICIKQADGTIIPVFDCSQDSRKTLAVITANRGQQKADIVFFHTRTPGNAKARRLGSVRVNGIAPSSGERGALVLTIEKADKKRIRFVIGDSAHGESESMLLRVQRRNPLLLAAGILYGIAVLGLFGFLLTQTFQELSLETLFGITL